MSRTIFRKFDVQARRKGSTQGFTPWTLVADQERAAEHAAHVVELGYETRVVELYQEATENEILKALKCCREKTCEDCPYDHDDTCYSHLQRDVADVIMTQRRKVARLESDVLEYKESNRELINQINTLRNIIAEEVIERLYEKSDRIVSTRSNRSDKLVISEASINKILKEFGVKKDEDKSKN